jgi:hypothetical protein
VRAPFKGFFSHTSFFEPFPDIIEFVLRKRSIDALIKPVASLVVVGCIVLRAAC